MRMFSKEVGDGFFFERIDMKLQKDLIQFVKDREALTGKQTLGDALVADIIGHIISGECRISGCATNHKKKTMYLEFTFYDEDNDADAEGAVSAGLGTDSADREG